MRTHCCGCGEVVTLKEELKDGDWWQHLACGQVNWLYEGESHAHWRGLFHPPDDQEEAD